MEKCNVHIVGSGLEYFADEKEWLEKIENFEMEVDEFLGDVIIDFVAEKEVALEIYSKICAKDPDEVINLDFRDDDNNVITEYINDKGIPYEMEKINWDLPSRFEDEDE